MLINNYKTVSITLLLTIGTTHTLFPERISEYLGDTQQEEAIVKIFDKNEYKGDNKKHNDNDEKNSFVDMFKSKINETEYEKDPILVKLAYPVQTLNKILKPIRLSKEQELESKIKTNSLAGQIYINKILHKSEKNHRNIEKHKTIIKELAENKGIAQELSKIIYKIKEGEKNLIWALKHYNENEKHIMKQFYFQTDYFKKFNTNEKALNKLMLGKAVGTFITSIVALPLSFSAYIYLLLSNLDTVIIRDGHRRTIRRRRSSPLGVIISLSSSIIFMSIFFKNLIDFNNKTLNSNIIKEEINFVKKHFSYLKSIKKLIKQNKTLSNLLSFNQESLCSDQLQKLLKTRKSNFGKDLAILKLLRTERKNIFKDIIILGKIDAYLSIAKIYNELKTSPNLSKILNQI